MRIGFCYDLHQRIIRPDIDYRFPSDKTFVLESDSLKFFFSYLADQKQIVSHFVDASEDGYNTEIICETRKIDPGIKWYVNNEEIQNAPPFSIRSYGYSQRLAITDPNILRNTVEVKARVEDDTSVSLLKQVKPGMLNLIYI